MMLTAQRMKILLKECGLLGDSQWIVIIRERFVLL